MRQPSVVTISVSSFLANLRNIERWQNRLTQIINCFGIFFNAGLPHTQYERSQRSSPQGPPLCRSVDNAWHGSKPAVCGAAFLGIRPSPEQAEKLLEYPAGDTNEFGGHQRIIDRAADT